MTVRSLWLCARALAVTFVLAACSEDSRPTSSATVASPSAASSTVAAPTATSTPAASPTPSELTPEQIVARMQDSVVNVQTTYPGSTGGGSGIVWGDATHIVTNAHIVAGAGSIKVVEPSTGKAVSAKVVAVSSCDDIALLSVSSGKFVPAPLAADDSINTGEAVVALGYPATIADASGAKLSVTRGIVSKLGESFDGIEDLIQTDAPFNAGSSGGPLVDTEGNVIGMNAVRGNSGQNTNFSIAIGKMVKVTSQLASGKSIDYTGLKLMQNDPALGDDLGIFLAYTDGLFVVSVDAGSPADEAGLAPTDLIYHIDNVSVATVGDVCDILRSRSSGATVGVEFVRSYSDETSDAFVTNVVMP